MKSDVGATPAAGRHFSLPDRSLICAGPQATTSTTPLYFLIPPVTQTDLSRYVFSGSPSFSLSEPLATAAHSHLDV